MHLYTNMDKDQFDEQALPLDNSYEGLETISRSKLSAVFPVQDFELRDESLRDKGIDLTAEIKRKGRYTGFRFAIQLKATASTTYNTDGSISYAIMVSNLNYLMNSGLGACYILYESTKDCFYYEHAAEVERRLGEKFEPAKRPSSFTVRFDKLLDGKAAEQIHNDVFEKGILLRNINTYLNIGLQQSSEGETIVIEPNSKVYSVQDKIALLEAHGYEMINQAKFAEIIEMENQCLTSASLPANFCFICGLAHYHQTNMFKAIDYFKRSLEVGGLDPVHLSMLSYHLELARFSLGMINRDRLDDKLSELMASPYLGLYLKAEKAQNSFFQDDDAPGEKWTRFVSAIAEIKGDPQCDLPMEIIAESTFLKVEGSLLNDKVTKNLILQKTVKKEGFSQEEIRALELQLKSYNERTDKLRKKALTMGNLFSFYEVCLSSIKTRYNFFFCVHLITNFNKVTAKVDAILSEDDVKLIETYILQTEEISEEYRKRGSMSNCLAALAQQFELLTFLGRRVDADIVAKRMESIIEANDLNSSKAVLEKLVNKGTSHEKFLRILVEKFESINRQTREFENINEQIRQIDLSEKNNKRPKAGTCFQLHVFPLGIFLIKKEVQAKAFDLLGFSETTRDQVLHVMTFGAMPIVNVLNRPVVNEGVSNGLADFRGLKSQRNLYEIRKGLSELQAYRISC